MYNKDLCRKCGYGLAAHEMCNDCLEIIEWRCKRCNNLEQHLHVHEVLDSRIKVEKMTVDCTIQKNNL